MSVKNLRSSTFVGSPNRPLTSFVMSVHLALEAVRVSDATPDRSENSKSFRNVNAQSRTGMEKRNTRFTLRLDNHKTLENGIAVYGIRRSSIDAQVDGPGPPRSR